MMRRCQICKEYVEDCTCPQCPVCHSYGCDDVRHALTAERITRMEDALRSIVRADVNNFEHGENNPEEFINWAKSRAVSSLGWNHSHSAACIDASGRCTVTGEL